MEMNLSLQTDRYRGLPFWSWNGRLCDAELRRQIRIFREMGYGGFFIHSRTGLNTDYLGEEWFHAVRVCIDEAKKQKLEAWLYDEDRYASGSAGGEIGRKKQFRRRSLEFRIHKEPLYRMSDLAWFAGKLRGNSIFGCRRLEKGEKLRKGESFLRFYLRFVKADSWNNGGYSPDLMNKEAMRKFIGITHNRYAEECGAAFGIQVPGIFSDEPNCSNWTDRMEEKFAKRYGIDLLNHLPELFFEINGEACSKLRWQMANLRTELLVSSFAEQSAKWCASHHLLFTGHVFGEEDVVTQTLHCGSAMRFVWHMNIPGVDLLSDHQLIYDAMIQTSSIAHQTGKRQVISESFAGTGWDYSLCAQKACMDWQMALGVTRFCMHLAFYTLQGEAKRDYPPSIHYQSPYCKLEKKLQDYASTIGFMLGSGNPETPILVIHPLESTWFWKPISSYSREDREKEIRRLPRLRNVLLRAKLAFDYADEAILADCGRVEGKSLRVCQAAYSAVVLPELRTIRITTLKLLETFADNGGKVIYTGAVPKYADAEHSPEPGRIYRKFIPECLNKLPDQLNSMRYVSITDKSGSPVESILVRQVRCEAECRLFLCNTGTSLPLDSGMDMKCADERTVAIPCAVVRWQGEKEKPPFELDPFTGNCSPLDADYKDGWWKFETRFNPLESKLILTGSKDRQVGKVLISGSEESFLVYPVSEGPWEIHTDEPNVLPLDFAEYSIDGGKSLYGHVREADAAVRRVLGIPERSHEMVQPWKQKYLQDQTRSATLTLRFRFECRAVPEVVALALEEADRYDIFLNGHKVRSLDGGWWADTSLRTLKLPIKAMRIGENILELTCAYCGAMSGLEAVYLLGDFGVFENELTEPVRFLNPGDWVLQGFPYYSGNITYLSDFEWNEREELSVFPQIREWRGSALGIRLNGGAEQTAFHSMDRLDLGKMLKQGRNTLEVTIYGSRRNSFGPFGKKFGAMTTPSDFVYSAPTGRILKPYGLMSGIQLYCQKHSN